MEIYYQRDVVGTAIDTDIYIYTSHTVPLAASSKANEKQVPVEAIMAAGMWSQTSTLCKVSQ